MMTSGINTRELILEILLKIDEEGEHSHIAIRDALSKYQFLPKQDRAFITRVCEGTLEYRILIDYIIDSFSKISVDKMKPPIREILRSAVYQLKFMDRVPDSAVCNEAVKLAQRKGFYNLKPFVNGVLRTVSRQLDQLEYPVCRSCCCPAPHSSAPDEIAKNIRKTRRLPYVSPKFHAYQLHKPLFPICCIPRCGSACQSRIVKFFTHLLKKPAFAFKTLLIF